MRHTLFILAILLSVPAFAQAQGSPRPGPAHLWVLDGYGEVHVLPEPPLIINLPGGVPMEMVRIPAGSFLMGSDDDWGSSTERPVHSVSIDHDFYLGKYEVTQEQWLAVMGDWPGRAPWSAYGVGDRNPAYYLSWDDCRSFIDVLNQMGQGTFRLPSEAEWEYACRAGTTTRFSFGDSTCAAGVCMGCDLNDYAWWCGTFPYGSHPVGRLIPNAFGLYDMHGNVWEWCQDHWHDNYIGAPADGSAWESPASTERVLRGGFWDAAADTCRSAARLANASDTRAFFGFRLVRALE